MTIKIHAVKIAPKYLDAVVAGQKKAELRKNDRGYKTGDVLSLCEWKHGKYTGRVSIRSLSPLEVLEYIISNGVTEALAGGGQYGR
ncbi:hypothetical protein DO802_04795 [Salmonella enterica subsp. enterica]|nr:hypothetical protein [Salmonella enterica subsp. enterica]